MFSFSSVEQYHAQLNEGRVTCVQAVEHYLQKISSSSHLNAFVEVFASESIQTANSLDEKRKSGQPIGRLHGVVIGIKDVICFKDHKVSAASAILSGFTSLFTATAVQRLIDEDAIIIGNLNCDEFGMGSTNENSTYGKVLNPIDETRVPGGSSGGSAAALKAGLCMIALGTDTGGSVRQPASFCGIVGMKPTYGKISRYGLIAYASSFDQIGIFGLSIPDVALALEIMSGPDEFDSTVSSKPLDPFTELLSSSQKYKLAYFPEAIDHPALDPEMRIALKDFIEEQKSNGHICEPVSFEYLDYIVPAYYVLTTAEASSNLARYDGLRYGNRDKEPVDNLAEFYTHNRSRGFGKEVKRRIMLGTFVLSTGYYDAYYTKAQQVRRLLKNKTEKIFHDFDFILMPVAPASAFKIGEKSKDPISMYLSDIYTVYANLCGIPAISLPIFNHSNGLPYGLQLLTNRHNELSLLRFSHQLMQQYEFDK